jgi:hypothetical protein
LKKNRKLIRDIKSELDKFEETFAPKTYDPLENPWRYLKRTTAQSDPFLDHAKALAKDDEMRRNR